MPIAHEVRRDERGFTLVEMMAAVVILLIGMLGALTLLDGANARISETRAREAATNLAREIIEGTRAVPYPDITPESLQDVVAQQPGLADSSTAAGWNVERRGTTFTVTISSCIMDDDDPRDGTGDHTGLGTFCANSPGGGTADRNPDDYKRISVHVTGTAHGRKTEVRQTAVINNPGSAFAPSVRTLRPTTPALTAPYRVTSTATTSVTFTANITPRASYAYWYVDNIKQGNAAASPVDNWTFTWDVPATLSDGVYLISAQGYNAYDQTGNAKAISVTLNRFPPTLPTGFAAGRNGSVGLEFEWSASPDRDVTGYRVYRMVGSSPATTDALTCSTSLNDALPTSCIVPDIPGDHRYYVVAVAPACCAGSGQEESTRPTAAQTVLVTGNVEPNTPKNLTGVRDNGVVTLTWEAPDAPVGGEASDGLRYYRIYRDGQAVADRYSNVAPDTLTFTDLDPGVVQHKYWVTAVDTHMAESDPAGEVEL